jgi:hypothetical protein
MNITILTLPGQRFSKVFNRQPHIVRIGAGESGQPLEARVETVAVTGVHALDVAVQNAMAGPDDPDRIILLSNRREMVWDGGLVDGVLRSIATFAMLGCDWSILSCDGGAKGGPFEFAVFSPFQQNLAIHRQIKPIDCFTGSFIVMRPSALRDAVANTDDDATSFNLRSNFQILPHAACGAFYVPGLYPTITADNWAYYHDVMVRHQARADASEAQGGQLADQVRFDGAVATSRPTLVSFVVRTVFKRRHLLNRCLISIDYLVRNLSFDCEVILATDQPLDVWERALLDLKAAFPALNLAVVSAENRLGFSRVRNLVAGIAATSGDRVAIIDDDDFYSTDAIGLFAEVADPFFSSTLIFDSQILTERWQESGEGNWERQILSYDTRFLAREWPVTIFRHNALPLCSVVHQGRYLRSVIDQYQFDFDLSEDFILHAMLFSDIRMPTIACREIVGAYQSHRVGAQQDNVSTNTDRTEWDADTAAGVRDLIFRQGVDFLRFEQIVAFQAGQAPFGGQQTPPPALTDDTAAVNEALYLLAAASIENRPSHFLPNGKRRSHLGFLIRKGIRKLRMRRKTKRAS